MRKLAAWLSSWAATLHIKFFERDTYRVLTEPFDPDDYVEVGPQETGDWYWDEVMRAVGTGTPSILLGTSTRSLEKQLRKLRKEAEFRAGQIRRHDMYKLYRGETACDSDDFGPPRGEYLTLALAMVAAGLPVRAWRTDRFCPDEIFTYKPGTAEVDWQVIGPAAAAEYTALATARAQLSGN